MSDEHNPDKTRQIILEAAFAAMHRNGFRASSLSDILAQTGLTKGAFYHHFPTKEALGHALIAQLGERTDEHSISLGCPCANLSQEMSPVEEGFRLRFEKPHDLWCDGIADALRRGQANGTVRSDIEPEQAAVFFVAAWAGCRTLDRALCSVICSVYNAGKTAAGGVGGARGH